MPKSDIVFGSEFSPAVIDLPRLLKLVAKHRKNRAQLQAAIDKAFFPGKGKNANPRKTLADNTILSLIAYGVLNRTKDPAALELTDFGKNLVKNKNNLDRLSELMGKHCLTKLDGLRIVARIRDLIASGEQLKKSTITKRLREEGLHIPENGKHLNVLRQWLEFAGILNPNRLAFGDDLWTPNDARIESLLGVATGDIESWSQLTKPQYDFARAFALMNVESASSSSVRDSAVSLYGTEFPEGGLPQSVLHALQDAGLIRWEKTTGGRGAKAHLVYPTEKLRNDFLEPILKQCFSKLGRSYKKLVRMSLEQVLDDLHSSDRHKKGIALEALAFYFARRLDLEFVEWRLRSSATGGAEVDLIVEGARLMFSRWQIQCKNTAHVSLDDLAKEVGVAVAINSNVIMMVSTGNVGPAVIDFAKKVMRTSPIQIILLTGKNVESIKENPGLLINVMNAHAREAMTLKRSQVS
jgi:hypothetical protein